MAFRLTPPEPRRPKITHLTPFLNAWTVAYGGRLAIGPAAYWLTPIDRELGTAEALSRWHRYLRETPARFASPARFAQTVGSYQEQADVFEQFSRA